MACQGPACSGVHALGIRENTHFEIGPFPGMRENPHCTTLEGLALTEIASQDQC